MKLRVLTMYNPLWEIRSRKVFVIKINSTNFAALK